MTFPVPPTTLAELQQRMDVLAGMTLADVADYLAVEIPENLLQEKGWVGQLIEAFLGASAGNLPEPDFVHLGIELKTLPIDSNGKPLETTFVCVAPLAGQIGHNWRDSTVYKKLNHVLWVPIIAERSIPLAQRQVAMPFLMQLNEKQEARLKADWLELTDMITFGQHDKITAKAGEILQLRPKAADSSVRTDAFDEQGNPVLAPPKGFYIRTQFTHELIKKQFQLDDE